MTLAWMFDYAVNGCRIEGEDFYRMFLTSTYVHRFETGNCSVVAGLSGVELAQRVIWEKTPDEELPQPVFSLARSPEYWLGFSLVYYQWYYNLEFEQITDQVTITSISAAPDCQATGISEADLPQPERTGRKSGRAVADNSAV